MIKRFALLGLALFLATVAWAGSAEDQFLFFQDLEVGMEGIGKTIIRGPEIRNFQARIVGLIDAPGELNDFIEIRVSGDVIREAGGVASGMSGSPIYVGGKLIGALSRAISFDSSPSPFALVTPIGPMLKLIAPTRELASAQQQQQQIINTQSSQTDDPNLQTYTQLQLVSQLPSEALRRLHPKRYYALPISTPLQVSGMSQRAFSWFRAGTPTGVVSTLGAQFGRLPGAGEFLQQLSTGTENRYPVDMLDTGLSGRAGAPQGSTRSIDDLVPGGGIGVTLADGDVTVGALGTVTYREDNVVLGFGHQFLFSGDAAYFLTRAYIYDTVANLQVPFKFGTTTDRVGTLLQDRFQGIAGAVGTKPKSVRMNVRLTNGETDEVSHYSVDLVQNDTFLPSIVFSSGLSLLDRTLNRMGKGTLSIDYTIRGAGLPRRLERTDIFTSRSDIAVSGPLQVAQVVFLLAQNEFQAPKLDTIDVDMVFTPEVKAARLTSVTTDKDSYKPGDVVQYTANFLPFRGEPFSVSGEITIPESVRSRRLTLHVFGGPRPSSNNNGNNGNDSSSAPAFKDLGEIIDVVEQLSRNDELTAELTGISSNDLGPDDEPYDVQLIRAWVINGEERLTLKIVQSSSDQPGTSTKAQDPESSSQDGTQTPDDDQEGSQQSEQSCNQLFFC